MKPIPTITKCSYKKTKVWKAGATVERITEVWVMAGLKWYIFIKKPDGLFRDVSGSDDIVTVTTGRITVQFRIENTTTDKTLCDIGLRILELLPLVGEYVVEDFAGQVRLGV
jgi:hypothetical protein